MEALHFHNMEKAATEATRLATQIKYDGKNVVKTITALDWTGQTHSAAEIRAVDENQEFRRTAFAMEDLAAAITAGKDDMSRLTGKLKSLTSGYVADGFDVAQNWAVTDGYNYAVAELLVNGLDVPNGMQLLADLKARRLNEAKTATTKLTRLAHEFDAADTACARAIDAATQDINRLAPARAALGGGLGQTIAKKLSAGTALTDFERRALAAGAMLTPEQLQAMRTGKPFELSQGQFDFLTKINRGLDGKSMSDILKIGEGPHHKQIQHNLAAAVEMMGIPNLRTADGDRGGMAQVPNQIRSLLTRNLTSNAYQALPDENEQAPGTYHHYYNIDGLSDLRALSDFISHGDAGLQGSDINRGIEKQVAEINGATAESGRAMSPGMKLGTDQLDKLLSDALVTASQDHIATHDFITGKNMDVTCDNGGHYNAWSHLNDLNSQSFGKHTAGLHGLYDWVGAEANSPNPASAGLAHDAANALGHYLGTSANIGDGGRIEVLNADAARIVEKAIEPYLADFVLEGDLQTLPGHDINTRTPGELQNIFRALNTDGVAAANLNLAASRLENEFAYRYGLTGNGVYGQYTGVLAQAMVDGNQLAVHQLSDDQNAHRMAEYENRLKAIGTAKDAASLFPPGALIALGLSPLSDALAGTAPGQQSGAVQGNSATWVDTLNDPQVLKFSQFVGYSQIHPEIAKENPEWFTDGKPDWNAVHGDPDWKYLMLRISDSWSQGYDDGRRAPDIPGQPGPQMPKDPTAPVG
ncbi:hypothetical protein QSJ18_15300 [Gordonia sp. ABSL1-1]|uniref:TPR repeat region-containing protein n=1 Tax=Gordonia sp. ABSL1-1 TaxID=3053923 RepID=UPI0025732FCC|nr:hypothetical protein [Gordonia sp. ABSL1-1]MDL9938119.1 hypothetical protein [Gordonia sp. ABSL1-1]